MTRYVVTVKENGDSFHAFDLRKINQWIGIYEHSCLNQDVPWKPHFEIKTESIKEERKCI